MKNGKGNFEIETWDENPYEEKEGGPKLTRAHITQKYQGVCEGESKVEYLMTYCPDGSASFVGVEHFTGSISGKSGSVVFQHVGLFEGGIAKSNWVVVKGSGSDGLLNLHGSGQFSAEHGGKASYSFEYQT